MGLTIDEMRREQKNDQPNEPVSCPCGKGNNSKKVINLNYWALALYHLVYQAFENPRTENLTTFYIIHHLGIGGSGNCCLGSPEDATSHSGYSVGEGRVRQLE